MGNLRLVLICQSTERNAKSELDIFRYSSAQIRKSDTEHTIHPCHEILETKENIPIIKGDKQSAIAWHHVVPNTSERSLSLMSLWIIFRRKFSSELAPQSSHASVQRPSKADKKLSAWGH